MIVLAIPALSMRLSFEDSSTAPHSTMAYTAHSMLAQGFGAGYDAPLVVVTAASHVIMRKTCPRVDPISRARRISLRRSATAIAAEFTTEIAA